LHAVPKARSEKLLVAYPNNAVWNKEAMAWEGHGLGAGAGIDASFGGMAAAYAGVAQVIGGCCSVTPGDIGILAAELRPS